MFMSIIWIVFFFKLHKCAQVRETSKNLSVGSHVHGTGEIITNPARETAHFMSKETLPICNRKRSQKLNHLQKSKKLTPYDEKKIILHHILVSIEQFENLYKFKYLIRNKEKQITRELNKNKTAYKLLREYDKNKKLILEDWKDSESFSSDESPTISKDFFLINEAFSNEQMDADDCKVVKNNQMASEALGAIEDVIPSCKNPKCEYLSSDDNMITEDEHKQPASMSTDFFSIDSGENTEKEKKKTNSNIYLGDSCITKGKVIKRDDAAKVDNLAVSEDYNVSENNTESERGAIREVEIQGEEKVQDEVQIQIVPRIQRTFRIRIEEDRGFDKNSVVENEDDLRTKLLGQLFVDPWDLFAYAKDLSLDDGLFEENETVCSNNFSLLRKRKIREEIDIMQSKFFNKKLSLIKTDFLGQKIDVYKEEEKYLYNAEWQDYTIDKYLVCLKKLARNRILMHREALITKIKFYLDGKDIYNGEMAEKINVEYLEINGWKKEFYQFFRDESQIKIAEIIAKEANKLTFVKRRLDFLSKLVPEETHFDLEDINNERFPLIYKQNDLNQKIAIKNDKDRRKNLTKEIMNLFEYEEELQEFVKSNKWNEYCKMMDEIKGFYKSRSEEIMSYISQALFKPLKDLNKCRRTVDFFLNYEADYVSNIFWGFLDNNYRYNIDSELKDILFPEIRKTDDQKSKNEDKLTKIMIEQLIRINLIIINDYGKIWDEHSQHNEGKFEILMSTFTKSEVVELNNSYINSAKDAISDVIFEIIFDFLSNHLGEKIESKKTELQQIRKVSKKLVVHFALGYIFAESNTGIQQIFPAFKKWIEEFSACWNFICENTLLSCFKLNNAKIFFEMAKSEKNQGDRIIPQISPEIKVITKDDRLSVLFIWYVFYMLTYTNYFIDHFFIINKEIPNKIFYELLITYNRWEHFKCALYSYGSLKTMHKENNQYNYLKRAIRWNIIDYKNEFKQILEELFISKTISLRQ